jgi:hypothetical protein
MKLEILENHEDFEVGTPQTQTKFPIATFDVKSEYKLILHAS